MEKRVYAAPEAETLSIKSKGCICQSGTASVQDYTWYYVEEE